MTDLSKGDIPVLKGPCYTPCKPSYKYHSRLPYKGWYVWIYDIHHNTFSGMVHSILHPSAAKHVMYAQVRWKYNAWDLAQSSAPTDMWDLCPSNNSRICWPGSRCGINLRKCSSRHFLNTSPIDKPESDTGPAAPGVAPSISSGSMRFPGNTKKGGIATPPALPQPKIVVVLDRPAVTALICSSNNGRLLVVPFSSKLNIRWGLSLKLYPIKIFWCRLSTLNFQCTRLNHPYFRPSTSKLYKPVQS